MVCEGEETGICAGKGNGARWARVTSMCMSEDKGIFEGEGIA